MKKLCRKSIATNTMTAMANGIRRSGKIASFLRMFHLEPLIRFLTKDTMIVKTARKTWWMRTQPENDSEIDEPEDKGSAEDGVRTHDLRISLEEVCRPEPYESDAPPG